MPKSRCAALDAANLLAAAYAEQAIAVRRRNDGPHFGLLAGDLTTTLLDDSTARQFLRSFNAAELPICWRDTETTEGNMTWVINDKQVEWCRAHGLKILAGPLLMLDPQSLPDWLLLFEDDFESVLQCVSTFITAAVERYRGRVEYWICAGRVNAAELLSLSEHERLRLVVQTIELIHLLDPGTPVLVSFDQPWAEYMRPQHSDFPPLQFADALVRAGLDVGGLMMEINVSYQPGGTLPRHPIEFSRQLDEWARLGLPLWLSLSAPSGDHDDPLAQRRAAAPPGGWTPIAQQRWAARFVSLALAKPSMRGVLWNQLCDSKLHDFPHAGLFDAERQAKPVLRHAGRHPKHAFDVAGTASHFRARRFLLSAERSAFVPDEPRREQDDRQWRQDDCGGRYTEHGALDVAGGEQSEHCPGGHGQPAGPLLGEAYDNRPTGRRGDDAVSELLGARPEK